MTSNLSQALGHVAGRGSVGAPLAIVVLVWLLWRSPGLFRRHPGALGGAAAAVLFYVLAAVGRDRIGATVSPSRYAYVGAALLLPALALLMSGVIAAVARYAVPTAFSGWRLDAAARAVLVSLVVAATVSNAVAGVSFARSRTVYVRGLENEIVTTGALLQSPVQLARAIDPYPIWASGFAAGYLTPGLLAHLYREGLLPRARPGLMTASELLNDESWLDLTGKRSLPFNGRFRLLGAVGLTLSPVASGAPRTWAAAGWPWPGQLPVRPAVGALPRALLPFLAEIGAGRPGQIRRPLGVTGPRRWFGPCVPGPGLGPGGTARGSRIGGTAGAGAGGRPHLVERLGSRGRPGGAVAGPFAGRGVRALVGPGRAASRGRDAAVLPAAA